MTPAIRQNPRPVGPILPMTEQDARYPHSQVMPERALRGWKLSTCNRGKSGE